MTDDESNPTDDTPAATRRQVLLSTAAATIGGSVATATATAQSEEFDVEIAGAPSDPVDPGSHVRVSSDVDSAGAYVATTHWDHGDGTRTGYHYDVQAYDEPGVYNMQLFVTDEEGRYAYDSEPIRVGEDIPVADVSLTYESSSPDEAIVELTLENPEVLDRDDVDSFEVITQNTRINVEDPGDFDGSFDRWAPDTTVEKPTMRISIEIPPDLQKWTHAVDDTTFAPLAVVDPNVSFDADHPDATESYTFDHGGADVFMAPAASCAFFGQHDRYTEASERGTLQLIVPDGFDPETDPERILSGLSEVAAAHGPGPESMVTVGLSIPADGVEDAAGKATGTVFFTDYEETFDEVESVWLHEYIHVLDEPRSRADSLKWLTEAYADYYASVLPLELEHGPYESEIFRGANYREFYRSMEDGLDFVNWNNRDLRDPENYDGSTNKLDYDYGGLVVGAIDREIRAATDDMTFEDVVDRLYDIEDADHEDFREVVADVGNDDIEALAHDWIVGNDHPEPWSAAEHADAFGYGVTTFEDVTLTGVVDGERRELDGNGTERVDVDEPLQLELTVRHPDSTPAATISADLVDAGFASDDVTVDTTEITGSGEVTAVLEHQFQSAYWTEFKANWEIGGPFGGSVNNDIDHRVLALDSDATLVRATDDTTSDDPATVAYGEQLALLLDQYVSGSAEVVLEGETGDTHSVGVGDNMHLAVVSTEELVSGTKYTVEYPADGDETQYVEVVTECPGDDSAAAAEVDGQVVCDLDGDGHYMDVTGDGSVTNADLTTFFRNQHAPAWNERVDLFDFDDNGTVGQSDIDVLFEAI